MNGLYTYKHPTYVSGIRTYVEYEMRVAIVDERANKYQVKYLGFHASGVAVNSLHWVRKDKVKVDGEVRALGGVVGDTSSGNPAPRIDWLPYKD